METVEETPNPYNARKEWHTPEKPNFDSADGLFFEKPVQATPTKEAAPETDDLAEYPTDISKIWLADELRYG